jgi:hypothetical protein
MVKKRRCFKEQPREKGKKLTHEDIFKIRQDTRPREIIAKEYGICGRSVWEIKNKVTWKYLI